MLLLFFVAVLALLAPEMHADTINPIYSLPSMSQTVAAKKDKKNTKKTKKSEAYRSLLVATEQGLFLLSDSGLASPLWTGGNVEQILKYEAPTESGEISEHWLFRTGKGILFSSNLTDFELRNEGLPVLTIKKYDGQTVSFEKQVAELKDLCVNPLNSSEMVTATKDSVYFSGDGGKNWRSLGSMSEQTAGMKAVAVATMQDGSVAVFMSHPIFGLSYILPYEQKPSWRDIPSGIFMMPSLSSPDEISDILPIARTDESGRKYADIYFSQMYVPKIYKFNWQAKNSECIYSGREPADSIDGLFALGDKIFFMRNGRVDSLNLTTGKVEGVPKNLEKWKNNLNAITGIPNAACVPEERSGLGEDFILNETWMLYPASVNTRYASAALDKKSLYVSAYQCRQQAGIDKFKKIIQDNGLNSLVIDMKDDYGTLRYQTEDPLVKEKGYVTQYKIDIDHFVREFKKDGVYLVARIVVFKDKNLWQHDGGKFAVWNSKENARWQGTKGVEKKTDEEGNVISSQMQYYDEFWVDPYAPEVWEYNVAIARELIARGFDEIQFDYIRFPTDGLNLYQAQYRHKSAGMDKESALISFLSYARENIDAPIGIDIYGANGWYRSGTRTGQDAELLAEYVDVICPMFYPSHFESSFLSYSPVAERTYRIYFYGTYRNTMLARNRAVIRPWVQAFRLAYLAFDRTYYGPDYIQKQIFGVRDSVNNGYMYWNNSGDYEYILPDVKDTDKYTGTTAEASTEYRKPALGTEAKERFMSKDTSHNIWVHESILGQEYTREVPQPKSNARTGGNFVPFLFVR